MSKIGSQLGTLGATRLPIFPVLEALLGADGPKSSPRAPQEPPKSAPRAPKPTFFMIFVMCAWYFSLIFMCCFYTWLQQPLLDSGLTFGQMWKDIAVDFWSLCLSPINFTRHGGGRAEGKWIYIYIYILFVSLYILFCVLDRTWGLQGSGGA